MALLGLESVPRVQAWAEDAPEQEELVPARPQWARNAGCNERRMERVPALMGQDDMMGFPTWLCRP